MTDFKKESALLIDSLKKYKNILILIKGSPDPDAIASSFAVKVLCDHIGLKSVIISPQNVSLPQNREMISLLEIPVKFTEPEKNISEYDAFVITDHQSAEYHSLKKKIPCAAHIDHHDPAEDDIEADFRLINTKAGSTSSMISLMIKESGISIDPEIMKPVATSLAIGIKTDTDKYDHAGELDYRALHYLSTYADQEIINSITSSAISPYTLLLIGKAIENKIIYKDWLIAGVGYVDKNNRDSIAITADFLLKTREASTVIVFAAIADSEREKLFIDASFRSSKQNLNLNNIIKGITSSGGARKYKGAYQIDIEYFIHCPDMDLLWKVIEMTTIEVLKQQRDRAYITGIKGIFEKFRNRMFSIFSD